MRYLRALTVMFILFVWAEATSYAAATVVPAEVKQAMQTALKESNAKDVDDKSGGFHETGFMWGHDKDGNLLILVSKAGKANPTTQGVTSLAISDFQDPTLAGRLVSIDGEFHVHPSGTYTFPDGRIFGFNQAPSAADISLAVCPINVVLGAGDGILYFYDSSGVTAKLKFKDLR